MLLEQGLSSTNVPCPHHSCCATKPPACFRSPGLCPALHTSPTRTGDFRGHLVPGAALPQNKPLLEEKREHEHASGTASVAKGHSCRARPGKPAAGGKRTGSAPPSPPTHCLRAHPPISHPPTKDLPPDSACRGCAHTRGGQPDLSSWVRIADQSRPGAGFQGQQCGTGRGLVSAGM